jgi:long-chain fatty acid transport protein
MGGASTAAPLDAAGATYWNPAAIVDGYIFVGVDFVYASTFLDFSVEATGAFGSNRNDSGLAAAPAFGVVSRQENSSYTYDLGIYSVVGRSIDFPGSEFNPVLKPWDLPNSFGFGPVSSRLSGLRIDLMTSEQISENIAVGIGGQVSQLSLSVDIDFFAERNGNGLFPPATQGRSCWGGGLQAGICFTPNACWNLGASYKSPQWFESFDCNSKDEIGNARSLSIEIEFPSVLSLGTAYKGLEDTSVAFDLRYFAYANTKFFGDEPGGGGLGWGNVWAMAISAERSV